MSYGRSRRAFRFGIILDKKRKNIENIIAEKYREKIQQSLEANGIPFSCKLSFKLETQAVEYLDFDFFEDEAIINPINKDEHENH